MSRLPIVRSRRSIRLFGACGFANKMNVMLVDTVGFIHRLPHMLIEAFKATLEEVRTASLLLHVVDASSPLASDRMKIVDGVLEEIGAGAAPRIMVMNKIDLMHDGMRPHVEHEAVAISARTGDGLDDLLERWRGSSPPRARKFPLPSKPAAAISSRWRGVTVKC